METVVCPGGSQVLRFLRWKCDDVAKNSVMSDKHFSANFFSLQLQLKSLLEDIGGEAAVSFLDKLSALNKSEQRIMVRIFETVVERVRSGAVRLETSEDAQLKNFEDNLYNDIVYQMQAAMVLPEPRRLEVVNGGKSPTKKDGKSPISLADRRRLRKDNAIKPLLN